MRCSPTASGTDPAEIAAVICGAHAQVLSAADLSLALRIQAGTPTTVRQVLWKEHRLIKTSGPRGTVHLLATDDLPMWMAALSAIPAHSPFRTAYASRRSKPEPRASREVRIQTTGLRVQAGLSRQGRRHDHHALLVRVRASHAAADRAVDPVLRRVGQPSSSSCTAGG
jgi:hypothetical protein